MKKLWDFIGITGKNILFARLYD